MGPPKPKKKVTHQDAATIVWEPVLAWHVELRLWTKVFLAYGRRPWGKAALSRWDLHMLGIFLT